MAWMKWCGLDEARPVFHSNTGETWDRALSSVLLSVVSYDSSFGRD